METDYCHALSSPPPLSFYAAGYSILHFDEFVDQLLTEERVCDIILPRLTKRDVLEETEGLAPRTSVLEDALEGSDNDEDGRGRSSKGKDRDDGSNDVDMDRSPSPSRRRDRSTSRSSAEGSDGRFISRSPSPRRGRSRSGSVGSASGSEASWRSRSRSISPDRLARMLAEAVGEGRWNGAGGEVEVAPEAGSVDSERLEGDV
jgi:pre-mRNA-splicing factor 38A